LDAVLQGKPPSDEVPVAVWWLLAESLAHSVLVRRATEGVEILDPPSLHLEARRGRLAAEAALERLIDATMSSPAVKDRPIGHRRIPANPTVRTTIRELARLIVTPRCTPAELLRAAILSHLDALRLAAQ
jgi:hypothetical protein